MEVASRAIHEYERVLSNAMGCQPSIRNALIADAKLTALAQMNPYLNSDISSTRHAMAQSCYIAAFGETSHRGSSSRVSDLAWTVCAETLLQIAMNRQQSVLEVSKGTKSHHKPGLA